MQYSNESAKSTPGYFLHNQHHLIHPEKPDAEVEIAWLVNTELLHTLFPQMKLDFHIELGTHVFHDDIKVSL